MKEKDTRGKWLVSGGGCTGNEEGGRNAITSTWYVCVSHLETTSDRQDDGHLYLFGTIEHDHMILRIPLSHFIPCKGCPFLEGATPNISPCSTKQSIMCWSSVGQYGRWHHPRRSGQRQHQGTISWTLSAGDANHRRHSCSPTTL